jgi:hypothetical protein
LSAVYKLSKLYWDQENMSKAKNLVQRVVKGYGEILGSEHAATLGAVDDLAAIHDQEGMLVQAQETYLQALEGKRKTLVAEHSSTLEWIILCGSGGVTRLDRSEISCQPIIFVFDRFSLLPLPLHPSLFRCFLYDSYDSKLSHPPSLYICIYIFVSALEPVLCVYTML